MAVQQKTLENFLQAMDIIASAQESDKADKTITCTIIDDSKAEKQNCYRVTDGSVNFDAYDNANEVGTKKYKINDQVYITIPQGDFKQTKLIQGPYVNLNDTLPVTYVSPLDTFLDMGTLASPDGKDGSQTEISGSLKSNGDKKELALWHVDLRDSNYDDLQRNNVYDTIGLQANFKCLLNSYNMRSGSYGLRMDLMVRLTPTSSRHVTKSLYLDSSEMFGNPYAFNIPSPQAQTYDISTLGIIDGIALYLYQNDDFSYYNGVAIQSINPETIIADNIIVSDIYVAFGSEILKAYDNTIKLYTDDQLTFGFDDRSDANNSKTLGFLWYNKTTDSKYIGFSDGLAEFKDKLNDGLTEVEKNENRAYDELNYLEVSAKESRLIDQKAKRIPTDKNGLEVSANWEDAKKTIDNILKLLDGDLKNNLASFKNALTGVTITTNNTIGTSMSTYFDDATNGKKTLVKKMYDDLKDAVNNSDPTLGLKEYFSRSFEAAYNIHQHQINNTTPAEKDEDDLIISSSSIYVNRIQNLNNNLRNNFYNNTHLFNDLKNSIENVYPSYKSSYEIWKNKINKNMDKLQELFDELEGYMKKLKPDKSGYDWIEDCITSNNQSNATTGHYRLNKPIIIYDEKDFSEYNNRYCVYWYKYDSKAIDEDGIMGNGWVRIKPGSEYKVASDGTTQKMIENLGMPRYDQESDIQIIDGVKMFKPKPKTGEGLLQIYLNPEKKYEKFKVAIFYNHEMFESNILEFENEDEILDLSKINASDVIEIENGTNSEDNYQTKYSSANTLINKGDAGVNRELIVHYKGLMGNDNLLVGAQVYWYVPRNVTMLDINKNKLSEFTTDYERTARVKSNCNSYQGPGTSYTRKNSYTTDNIVKVYDLNQTLGYYSLKTSNSIGVAGEWIHQSYLELIDDNDIYKNGYSCFYKTIRSDGEEDLLDENGNVVKDADGNKVKVKKVNVEDQKFYYKIKDYYTPTALNNTIFCKIKYGNEYTFETGKTFFFGQQGICGTDYTINVSPSGSQIAVKPNKPLELTVKAFDYNNVEIPIQDTSVDSNNISQIRDLKVAWMGPSGYTATVNSTNSNDAIDSIIITQKSTDQTYCGIAKVETTLYDKQYSKGPIDLVTYYPIPFSVDTENDYYIEGPTTIVYDSQGANPVYYKNPYKIYNATTDEIVMGNAQNPVTWSLTHYLDRNTTFTVKNEQYTENNIKKYRRIATYTTTDENTIKDINFYKEYVPLLNDDNTITPSMMYLTDADGFTLPFYSVVTCTYGGQVIWAQPLVIYQNRYPNSMINSWDGSLKIDEESGTILSTMVGAGIKNSDNTFSGVLMGSVDGAGTDSSNGLGLYGYHHGSQNYSFNVDGTAFIGKPGAGRIYFDGTHGFIYSQNWLNSFAGTDGKVQLSDGLNSNGTLKPGTDGMAIDLTTGHIDAYNFKLTSKNIYFNSNPKNGGYYFRIGNDGSTNIDPVYNENNYTTGFMSFSKNGDLIIRANSLSITGQSGGINLLRQTRPIKSVPVTKEVNGKVVYDYDSNNNIKYKWDVEVANGTTIKLPGNITKNHINKWVSNGNTVLSGSSNTLSGNTFYLTVSDSTHQISQEVGNIKKEEYYTISGYVTRLANTEITGTPKLNITIANTEPLLWSEGKNAVEFEYGKWTRFEYTFKTTNDISNRKINIVFKGNVNYCLWHVKLEHGAIATEWSPSPQDVIDDIGTESDKYDAYLAQDEIFDKLTIDPTTGNRMDGIWLIPVGDSSTGLRNELYINATYMATGILRSKNWDGELGKVASSNPAQYDKYGRRVYTYEITKSPTLGMYINLDEGKIWAAKFDLNAWTDKKDGVEAHGLRINSHPASSGNSYFRVGIKDTDEIQFYKTNSGTALKIITKNLTLNAGIKGQDHYLGLFSDNQGDTFTIGSSGAINNWRIIAGKNFGVTSDGVLYASGANISGNITADTLTGNGVTALEGRFNALIAQEISAVNANIDTLKVNIADIENLVATKASITALNSATAEIGTLKTDMANVKNLVATKASIKDLNAAIARIGTLEANSAVLGRLETYGTNAVATSGYIDARDFRFITSGGRETLSGRLTAIWDAINTLSAATGISLE